MKVLQGRAAMEGVTVRPMRRRHLGRVLAIESEVYPRPWSVSLFADELARPDSCCYLVALAPVGPMGARRLIGYAGLLLQGGALPDAGDRGSSGAGASEAHVTTVAVDPRHHRRKVATHLMIALLREARARGASSATLEVRAANRGAQRLYSAFGFVPVGVRPGYYAETREDAVIMLIHDLHDDDIARRLDAQRARLVEPGGASGAPDDPVPWVRRRVGLDRWGS